MTPTREKIIQEIMARHEDAVALFDDSGTDWDRCRRNTLRALLLWIENYDQQKIVGRAGGRVGGLAAAASMTPEQRKERGQKGAAKRWENQRLKRLTVTGDEKR